MNWVCGVDAGVLQWAVGGTALALFLSGFGWGMRHGYKMGRQAHVTLEQLRDRMPVKSVYPTRPPGPPAA